MLNARTASNLIDADVDGGLPCIHPGLTLDGEEVALATATWKARLDLRITVAVAVAVLLDSRMLAAIIALRLPDLIAVLMKIYDLQLYVSLC